MASATASAAAPTAPRLRPRQDQGGIPLRGGNNQPLIRLPAPGDDEFDAPVPAPAAPAAAPAPSKDAPAPSTILEPAPSKSLPATSDLLARASKATQKDLVDLFRKADVIGWSIVMLIGIGILASGVTGLIPHWGVLVGLVAFLATGRFVKDFVSAAFVAAVRQTAMLLLVVMFGAGAALFGAIGTIGWAFAVSGVTFFTFAMLLHHVHQEKLAVRVTVEDSDDDEGDEGDAPARR